MSGVGPLLAALVPAVLVLGAAVGDLPRAVQVLVAFALLVALVTIGWRGAAWLGVAENRLGRACAASVVAFAVATLVPTALGHGGMLRPAGLLLGVAAIYGLVTLTRAPSSSVTDAAGADGGDRVPPVALAPPLVSGYGWRRLDVTLLAAAWLALGAFILVTIVVLRGIGPGWMGLDDNSYHLTAVATWARHADLRMPKFSFGDPSTPFYPIGSELWTWSLLAPFRDSDVLARWAQLPFHLAALLAVGSVARRLGVSVGGAAWAALLYATVPRFFPGLALTAGNDASTSLFALAAVDGALALAHRPGPGAAAYLGLALGLLVGTKYIGLLYALPIVGVATLAGLPAIGSGRLAGRRVVGLLATAVAVALLAGGATYVRNWVVTGNPVFPAPVELFGQELLAGWEETTMRVRGREPEARFDPVEFLLRRSRIWGDAFRLTLLPAAVLAPFVALGLAWRQRSTAEPAAGPVARRRPLLTAAVLGLPAVFFVEFLRLMPDHRDIRYLAPAAGLAAVGAAWLTGRLSRPVELAARSLVSAVLLVELGKRSELGYLTRAVLLLVVVAVAVLLERRGPRWRMLVMERIDPGMRPRRWAALITAGLALAVAPALGSFVDSYQDTKLHGSYPHAPEAAAAAELERLAGDRIAVVAYVGGNRPYLFWGPRLAREMVIVPTAGSPGDRFFDYGADAGRPSTDGTYAQWRRNLDSLGVRLLVVIRVDVEQPERGWMVSRPSRFERVWADPVAEIWRVRRGRRGAPG